jgi:hypothetical protein
MQTSQLPARKRRASLRISRFFQSASFSSGLTPFIVRLTRFFSSISFTLTMTLCPTATTSSTFSTRRFSSCEMCTRPSLPGKTSTKQPAGMMRVTLPSDRRRQSMRLFYQSDNPVTGSFAAFALHTTDKYGAVIFDVDGGAGLFDDATDHLTARSNHRADIFLSNAHFDNARSPFG